MTTKSIVKKRFVFGTIGGHKERFQLGKEYILGISSEKVIVPLGYSVERWQEKETGYLKFKIKDKTK